MFRSHRLVAAIAAALYLWPAAATARAQELTPSDLAVPPRTVAQVRSAYIDSGYQVDQAYAWDWLQPPVTSVQVRDPANERVLLVLIYDSATAAVAAWLQAQSLEPGVAGPHLVAGYGASVWSGNVAMVQTTLRDLDRLYRARSDQNNMMHSGQTFGVDVSAPTTGVDLDFQQALEHAVVTL